MRNCECKQYEMKYIGIPLKSKNDIYIDVIMQKNDKSKTKVFVWNSIGFSNETFYYRYKNEFKEIFYLVN